MDVELKHIILAVHGIVGIGFLTFAIALFLAGEQVGAALRAVFGVVAIVAGVYLYRERERR